MYGYTPNILHPILAIVLTVGFIYFGVDQPAVGIVGGVLSLAVFGASLWAIIQETNNRRADSAARWMDAFAKLDDEGKAAAAFEFPTVRFKMKRGVVRKMFEDTNATDEHFRIFLQTSNQRYISPRRDWTTAEQPAWAWDEIKGWLEDHDRIIPDSAAGSHSWLWSGNSYGHFMAYWNPGRKMENLNEETRVYAYEEN